MNPSLFDPALLYEWKQIDPENWQGMVADLIDIFLSSAKAKCDEIQSAGERKDWKKLAESAHALKSSCGNVGAVRVRALLDEIEQLALKKDVVGCSRKLRELKEIFDPSLKAVVDFRVAIFKPLEEF